MKTLWENWFITARAFASVPAYLFKGRWHSAARPAPEKECNVPRLFFGICVASSLDPACDDFIVNQLKELEIRCVRVDIATNRLSFQERFLKRLINEQFLVCLHLVQTREDAQSMGDPRIQASWRSFVINMLDAYGTQVDLIEMGSTCNRKKWSGYTVPSYMLSWHIAWEEARQRNIVIAGPNVTDFEPVYNIALLSEMKRSNMLPAVHTDNLFVERATEPEAFDHKILGRQMAGVIRFNLVRKAQLLNDIARWAGVPSTVCTQVSWSLRRIARFSEDAEKKQADYLSRYCCLAAASGALNRVYWGPLIGQRAGLIDDGTSEFPDIPHVTFYGMANGRVSDYRHRPAFNVFKTVNHFITGTTFKRKLPSGHDLEMLEFVGNDNIIHVVWTTNGHCAVVSDCYDAGTLEHARFFSQDGLQLASIPSMFSESPVYITWPAGTQITVRNTPSIIHEIRFADMQGNHFVLIDQPQWKGAAIAEDSGMPIDTTSLLQSVQECRHAGLKEHGSELRLLRDSRNRVWSMPAPWNRHNTIIVKQFKPPRLFKRILQYGKPDKALRSWNSAQELIRRGINTPMPIAFFHHALSPSANASYYICHAFESGPSRSDTGEPALSVRQAFTAFSDGSSEFMGIPDTVLYDEIANFLVKVHNRGVFFRDLSAGNMLIGKVGKNDEKHDSHAALRGNNREPGTQNFEPCRQTFEFALIDTARARFYPVSLGLRRRLADLMRICHPLHWHGRKRFVSTYLSLTGKSFRSWMKIPFIYYDWKHIIKNAIKKAQRTKRTR